jgi:hypothetical protein
MDSFVTNMANAFANLAKATALDWQLFANLAAAKTTLLAQLTKKEAKIAKLQGQLQPKGIHTHSGGVSNGTNRRYNNSNYCWTYGWDVYASHNSTACKRPATGHQVDYTRANIKGGNDSSRSKVTCLTNRG